jgi:hypothetical protein
MDKSGPVLAHGVLVTAFCWVALMPWTETPTGSDRLVADNGGVLAVALAVGSMVPVRLGMALPATIGHALPLLLTAGRLGNPGTTPFAWAGTLLLVAAFLAFVAALASQAADRAPPVQEPAAPGAKGL